MEFTTEELCRETNFTKGQIYKWAERGILPRHVREENKGRSVGKERYYSEETLNRLLILKALKIGEKDIDSLRKKSTAGIPAMGYLLWLSGFDDSGIRENVRKFLKQAIKNITTSYRKSKFDFNKEFLSNDFMPKIVTESLIFRLFFAKPFYDVQLPEDSNEPCYDDFNYESFQSILTKFGIEEELDLDEYIEYLNMFLKLPPIKKLNEEIDAFPEEDFKLLQASTQFILGMQVSIFNKPPGKMLADLFNVNTLSSFALVGYYAYKFWVRIFKRNYKLKNELLTIPEKVKEVSDETIALKKNKTPKTKKQIFTRSLKNSDETL